MNIFSKIIDKICKRNLKPKEGGNISSIPEPVISINNDDPKTYNKKRSSLKNELNKYLPHPDNINKILKEISVTDKKFSTQWEKRVYEAMEHGFSVVDEPGEEDSDERAISNALKSIQEEYSEFCSYLNSHYMRYQREIIEPIDTFQNDGTDRFVKEYKYETEKFISEQFILIRDYIEKNHKARTGITDTFKVIFKKETFVNEAINKYFNENTIKQFSNSLLEKLIVNLDSGWQKIEGKIHNSLKSNDNNRIHINLTGAKEIKQDLDASTIVGSALLFSTFATTAILTAGWHTLVWTLGGLTVWMLPVSLLLTGIVAVFTKEKSKNTKIDKVTDHEKYLKDIISDNVEYKIRSEILKSNQDYAIKLKRALFEQGYGKFEPQLLYKLACYFEDFCNEIYNRMKTLSAASSTPFSASWLNKAKHELVAGEDIPAAIFGTIAFEELLHDLNNYFGTGFNFKQEGHNYQFIEYLIENKKINESQGSLLHSLRDRRNNFTHRLYITASRKRNKRQSDIKSFIDDIETLYKICKKR